ncbi:histidine phosphatase family protein [Azospirillum brasilense]|uniref:Histidine phosphatase family protein n=1 Tax=Azospirillum brasilense TaxID=192 RepID=A0A0P0E723_AZOBR|nr:MULTISPECIES: histidine phosphatase family protein [Azospirillum]ALJ33961.1 phosphoglycerate mutase [Azospirillum brasilense]MDW7557069.1 histidine phosphatase family protein [Azospirillum brasilense]MDW7591726.1 histidine phosphatase family protein [Azospirillum brasilense]MDW7627997.1 histidine phosphatase family protein [Azospirillum brasilense]MDX5952534.1 histidine phosphatase family protein [Azospirillum brasilense]
MTDLIILRHGPTAWNAAHRLQGGIDEPLSDEGRARVATWRLPPDVLGYRWVASPKRRAWETARLLGLDPAPEPRLVEMGWGEWEGRLLEELRSSGALTADRERMGLDFRAPGGESPRDVQTRLIPWLAEVGARSEPTGAVAHNGVMRALYALATGWDMVDKPAHRLTDGCAHRFRVAADGTPSVVAMNVPLVAES